MGGERAICPLSERSEARRPDCWSQQLGDCRVRRLWCRSPGSRPGRTGSLRVPPAGRISSTRPAISPARRGRRARHPGRPMRGPRAPQEPVGVALRGRVPVARAGGLRASIRRRQGMGPRSFSASRRARGASARVSISTTLTDAELASAYRQARCSVFVSMHEGYGLPVAESLAFGTPVIATDYGSTREIATGGGVLLVDPRDDEALVDGMRRLITDDDLLDSLHRQIANRPVRTWQEYASDLWEGLVAPERDRWPEE